MIQLNSYGDLSILKKLDNDSNKHVYYLCMCKCGNLVSKRLDKLKSAKINLCEECKAINESRSVISAINRIYNEYRKSAARRNLAFDIKIEDFILMINSFCHYCGSPPSNKIQTKSGYFYYCGIDRLNNLIGYVIDNCRASCKQCNFSKYTLTKEDFVNWARQVVKHNEKEIK